MGRPIAGVSPDQIKCAGINLGYGNAKVRTDNGYFQFVSDVNRATSRKFQDRLGLEASDTQLVTYQGTEYEVGAGACLISAPRRRKTIFPSWAGTEPYMVLMQAVLDRLAAEGSDWMITLGVPIKEMDDDVYTAKVRDLWLGEHQTAHGPVRIHLASVTSEPSGALFYYGTHVVSIETLRMQNLTIWDFGYFTTLGTTHHRLHADRENTVQIELGVSRVVEHINESIYRDYKDERDIVEVELAMLGKLQISIDNQIIDVARYTQAAVAAVGGTVINRMKTLMPRPASRIYLVGGGAHLFGQLVQKAYTEQRVDVCDAPQVANATGLWIMTQHQRKQAFAAAA